MTGVCVLREHQQLEPARWSCTLGALTSPAHFQEVCKVLEPQTTQPPVPVGTPPSKIVPVWVPLTELLPANRKWRIKKKKIGGSEGNLFVNWWLIPAQSLASTCPGFKPAPCSWGLHQDLPSRPCKRNHANEMAFGSSDFIHPSRLPQPTSSARHHVL